MLVNGKPSTSVSANDRGLAYGDGVFETIRVARGKPLFLDLHFDRLFRGCQQLGIQPPESSLLDADMRDALASSPDEAVIKIIVTRGEGKRGYGPTDGSPTRIVSWSAYEKPDFAGHGVSLHVCDTRLAINERLAGIKHLNRLEQVLAAAELPGTHFEGLVRDMEGYPVECTRSNVFIATGRELRTPRLDRCGVEGMLRKIIIDDRSASEERLTMEDFEAADEIFICNSVFGVLPVVSIDAPNRSTRFSVGRVSKELRDEFRELGL